ncbi:hypothetical protein D3C77_118430 [compost metagenome]
MLLGHQGAATVTGEQLGQQSAVFGVADDVTARHAAPAGFGRRIEQLALVVAAQALQVRGYLLRTQFTHQPPLLVEQATLSSEQKQLVGAQFDGRTGGDILTGQVEDLARGRVAQWRQQHDRTLVEQAVDTFAVNPAHFAGVVVIHPFDNADRPRGDQVACGYPQARTLHRRGSHVHRQARLDSDAQVPHGVDHTFQGRGIGDAHAAMVVRGQAAAGQAAFDLRTRAMHQHQANPQAVQQDQVVDDIAEVGVLDAVSGKHDHKGAVAVGIDVRRSMTQPIDVFGHNHRACREWRQVRESTQRSKGYRRNRLGVTRNLLGKTAELSG